MVLPIGHTGNIKSAEFVANEKMILTTADDGTAKLWDVRTQSLLVDFSDAPFAKADSRGQLLMVLNSAGQLRLYRLNEYKLLKEFIVPGNKILTACFNQAGNRIAVYSSDGRLRIWEAASFSLLQEFSGFDYHLRLVVFSKDDQLLMTVTENALLSVWNLKTGKLLNSRQTAVKNYFFRNAEFSPDGKKVLINALSVEVWDFMQNRILISIKEENDFFLAHYSPDGTKIAVTVLRGSRNVTDSSYISARRHDIVLHDAATGKKLMTLKGHSDQIGAITFSPDSRKLISTSVYFWVRFNDPQDAEERENAIRIWDLSSGRQLHVLKGHHHDINSASFNSSGTKMLTASFDMTVKLWEMTSYSMIAELKGHTLKVSKCGFSPKGETMYTLSSGYQLGLWSRNTGMLNQVISSYKENYVNDIQYSPDGKKFATLNGSTINIWDAAAGTQRLQFKPTTDAINSMEFNPSGSHLVIATGSLNINTDSAGNYIEPDPGLQVWDTDKGTLVRRFSDENLYPTPYGKAWFTGTDSTILSVAYDTIKIWDLNSGRKLAKAEILPMRGDITKDGKKTVRWEGSNNQPLVVRSTEDRRVLSTVPYRPQFGNFYFSHDGKKLAVSYDKSAAIWNLEPVSLAGNLEGHWDKVTRFWFSQDDKYLVTGCGDNGYHPITDFTPIVYETETGKTVAHLKGHEKEVVEAAFSPDNKHILTISWDNTTKLWQTETGRLISSFFLVDSGDHITIIPSGYYSCSRNASRLLHYVTPDLRFISFEQLDIKFNRPDKVLEAMGNTDTSLSHSYRKAWEKRIKKLGIDTSQFRDGYSVPECDFMNRDAIAFEQKSGTLKIRIRGIDSTYLLDRFNVWVNESPLYGQRGISIRKRNGKMLDTTLSIVLSQGKNRIETSVTNVNGTESYRMPLYVNYTPTVKQKETLRFIGIGIDQFADPANNLQYSSKDIRDLAIRLKERYKDDIIIDTLFNENVTREKVTALKYKLLQSSVNDKVIISYSGHGLLNKEYDYYLSTYSVNFDKPEENGLPYDELENLLDSIPARKKMLLIDACHSGEVDKEEMVRITSAEEGLKEQGAKGGKPVYTGKTTLGMKNSFELMQSLFVNVGRSTGATIISAAAGTQFALERGDLKNGVFTYCILEALDKNPGLKISELKRIVGERVEQLTNGLQRPTSRNEPIAVDWNL